jgi:DNA-binding NarL/FixJ family response regulator
MKPIRILLVDDHELVRAGLRALLEKISEVEIVGEAGNGREALRLIETLNPDLALMDIMMPELNGLDATARATSKFPHTRIIILSMNVTQEVVLQTLQAGAGGYLLKNISPAELEMAIRAVMRGEMFLSSAISQQVVEACLKRAASPTQTRETLTPRQRETLQLIAEGNSTKQIAYKLGISVKTAESHRTDLMEATDIHDIAGLTRYAIRMGLVTPDA